MRRIKRILLVLSVLSLLPALCLALVDFEYPDLIYLSPDMESYNLYTCTSYQIDVDPSQYTWESTDEDVASVSQQGKIWGKYNGKCRIIGTPKVSGLEKINIELNFPSFIYGGDYIEIDSPDGVFHEYKLQAGGISGMDYKVSGGVFKCEMASKKGLYGPDAMYLTPIKPGKGTLTYIYNSRYKIPVTVVVKESAFFTPSPSPTSTPVPDSTPIPEKTASDTGIVYEDGVFSESKSVKYQPYNYFDAFYNSASYKSTYVAMRGVINTIQAQDGICVVFFDVDGDASKEIMFFVEDSPEFEKAVKSGDQLSIKAMAMGDTTDLGMPVTFPLIEPFVIEKL